MYVLEETGPCLLCNISPPVTSRPQSFLQSQLALVKNYPLQQVLNINLDAESYLIWTQDIESADNLKVFSDNTEPSNQDKSLCFSAFSPQIPDFQLQDDKNAPGSWNVPKGFLSQSANSQVDNAGKKLLLLLLFSTNPQYASQKAVEFTGGIKINKEF